MNTEHAKQLLLKKEKALVADLDRLQGELTGPGDIGDPADSATTLEGEEEAGIEITRNTAILEQVRDALKRIEAGTYGRCVIDGRSIGEKRLEAIPWTPYCVEDQERIDREKGEDAGATL